jgi:alginate O-acetyltransferase complex protein AlgI
MLFNSFEFIFLFLPAAIVCVWFGRRFGGGNAAIYVVLSLSIVFYAWWNRENTFVLLGSVLCNFCFGLAISKFRKGRAALLIVALVLDVSLLICVKYLSFIIATIDGALTVDLPTPSIPFPLGISFFTFTQIAFLVDCYQRSVERFHFGRYALFVTFFPHLIAGPILHHREMVSQFERQRAFELRTPHVLAGLMLFTFGLAKKVLLADSVAIPASAMFDAAAQGVALSFVEAWIGTLAYALQLYFDFSAYCDMAIGIAFVFGIRMPANFNSPYKSTSIIEFWQRWHITLSRFLRHYLYVPLGGNRRGRWRQVLNVFVVMLVGGAWHGAGWTFLLWGALHGIYLALNHLWRSLRPSRDSAQAFGPMMLLSRFLTLAAVLLAWVPFRADSLTTTIHVWKAMLIPDVWVAAPLEIQALVFGLRLPPSAIYPAALDYTFAAVLSAVLLFAATSLPNLGHLFRRFKMTFDQPSTMQTSVAAPAVSLRPLWFLATGALCFLVLRQMSALGPSEFIYFNF